MAKILIIDIETAPKLAYVWRFFKENIGAKQVVHNGRMMSFAAKWLGEDVWFYQDARLEEDEPDLLKSMWEFLDEADIVVAHNAPFDLNTFAARCLVEGIKPPSPYRIIDTCRIARKHFLFESNSLEYLAKVLGCKPKDEHKEFPGFLLWAECMKGNPRAWDEMETYNVQDVDTLEEIYLKMRPWIRNHPNVAIFDEPEEVVCPTCGGKHVQKRGTYKTNVFSYQRYNCQGCGAWFRGRKNELAKEAGQNILMNV